MCPVARVPPDRIDVCLALCTWGSFEARRDPAKDGERAPRRPIGLGRCDDQKRQLRALSRARLYVEARRGGLRQRFEPRGFEGWVDQHRQVTKSVRVAES